MKTTPPSHSTARDTLFYILSVFCALAVWEIVSLLPGLYGFLASPARVVIRLAEMLPTRAFWGAVGFTFSRIALGFFLALIPGVLLAIPAARFKWANILLRPWMLTVKSVPVASFVILILIFFSASSLSAVIAALMVLPVIYTNTLAGLRSTDPKLAVMADTFGIGGFRRLTHVTLPQVKPYFLSGCRVALGLCWKAGVAAELIGQPKGSVGNALYLSKIYLETADLFAWTLVVIGVSFAFEKLVLWGFEALFRRGEKVR